MFYCIDSCLITLLVPHILSFLSHKLPRLFGLRVDTEVFIRMVFDSAPALKTKDQEQLRSVLSLLAFKWFIS